MNLRPVIYLFVLLIGIGVTCPASLTAQTLAPDKVMGRYTHFSWLEQHGLPHNSVYAITQTRDGYLWFGTAEGLVRFDGVRFKVFDSGNTDGIKIKLVGGLLEDREGSLWITTSGFGLIRLKDGRLTAYTSKDGLADNDVRSICEDGDGGLWIGTAAGLNHFKDGKFTAYTTDDGLAGDQVTDLLKDRRGEIWVGTRSGLSRLENRKFSNYTTRQGLSSDLITSLDEDQDGSVWIGTDGGGLSRFNAGRFTAHTAKEGLIDNRVRAIRQDYEGSLWVGTSAGLDRLKDGRFLAGAERDGMAKLEVRSVFEDRERNLWFGSVAGGLNLFKDGRFKVLTTKDGLSNNLVWAVAEDQEGGLWIQTETALNRLKDGKLTTYTAKDGPIDNSGNRILPDREGGAWFGNSAGLTRYRNGRFTSFTSREGLPDKRVISLCENRDGGLWVNTRSGLNRFKDGKFTAYGTVEGWSENYFHRCYEDRQGNLWAGTTTRGLFRFKDGRFIFQDVMPGPPYDQVISFYEDRAGAVWISTGGGLIRFKDEKFSWITSRDGLFDDLAFRILEDEGGNFWMSCNKGVYRVSAKELNDFADGRITRVTSYAYGTEDGMLSRECNGGQPSAWKTGDGRLWFPTIKGLAVVDPRQRNQQPPSVIIEEIFSDRQPFDYLQHTEIPPGQGEIEIHYTGLSWDVPQRVRFKYKLEGYDQDWVDAGARRAAYYTNLAPGRYTFRVKAANNDGVWNEPGAAYEFYLRPHFHQTWWFYALYAVALALLAAAAYRRRVGRLVRLKRELEDKVTARTSEIAEQKDQLARANLQLAHAKESAEAANHAKSVFLANMSHELRTPFNAILGFAQLMHRDPRRDPQDRERLDTILRSGEHLLSLINDVLSITKIESGKLSLHEERFDLRRVLGEIEGMFRDRAGGLTLAFDPAPDLPTAVRGDEGKLRQVLINLVGNALKFTDEGAVTVRARWRDGVATFAVADTGQGIAAEELADAFESFRQSASGRRSRQGAGLGLTISRSLVRLMGGELRVQSKVGEGTTFSFDIPLPAVAEADHAPSRRRVIGLEPGQEKSRVLIADDRWENRAPLAELLASVGFEVREALDGQEAVDLWREWRPRLIWMDMRMPVMDGFAATCLIRGEEQQQQALVSAGADGGPGRRTVIIALTASAFEQDRAAILGAGCDDYVIKPFRDATIFEKMAEHLGVRFVYEEAAPPAADTSPADVLTPQRLAAVPPEWLAELHEALSIADDQGAYRVVERIAIKDERLGQELRRMVKEFEFVELIRMIEEVQA